MVEARTAAPNQLWAILAEHWPGAALVFQKLTSQIALAFLADYLPNSLSQHVGLALGAQAGEERTRAVAEEGGFTRFRRAAETPFNAVYEARP